MSSRLAALLGCVLAITLAGSSTLRADEDSAGRELAPNEVRVYVIKDFGGPFLAWRLEVGMRQVLVQDFGGAYSGRIASIQMGSDVGAMLFSDRYFKFTGSNYVSLTHSVADFSLSIPGAANVYTSMIIFSRAVGSPLGVLAGSTAHSDFRFFPLPQSAQESTYAYADVRHLMQPMDFLRIFSAGAGSVYVTVFDGLSLTGQSLRLPTQGGGDVYRLADYGFAGRVASMKLDYVPATLRLQGLQRDQARVRIQPQIDRGALQSAAAAGTSSISGRALGLSPNTAALYALALYGPDDLTTRRETRHFNQDGTYEFTGLPNGTYVIRVFADPGKADLPYELMPPIPSELAVECTGGAVRGVDFTFDQ